MNALLKIASEKKDEDRVNKKAVAAGGLLVHMNAGKVAPRVIGYHKMYHGTIKDNVESIKKHGLDPKHGGKDGGAAKAFGMGSNVRNNFESNSKGKVHLAPHKVSARLMANFTEIRRKSGKALDNQKEVWSTVGKTIGKTAIGKGHVFTVHLSEGQHRRLKKDPDMGGARTFHKKIDPKQLQGGFKGMSSVVNKGTLKRHFTTKHGLKRVAHGLGNAGAAALGAKMLYDQAKKLKSKRIDGISNVAEEKHYV